MATIDTWRVGVRAEFTIELQSKHAHMSTDEVIDAVKERLEDSLGVVDIPHSEITAVYVEGRWFEAPPF